MRRAAACVPVAAIIALAAVAGSDGAERGGGCLDAAALSEFVTGFAGSTKPRRLSSGASSRGSRLSDDATRPVE